MQEMKKVFFRTSFLLISSVSFVFQSPVFANPTLSDVLSKGQPSSINQPNMLFVGLTAGLFLFAALSVTGYKLLKKNGAGQVAPVLIENTKDGQIDGLRREVKELTFQNEELNREVARLAGEKGTLLEDKQRLEDIVQSRVIAEELLKKSNDALRRAYDKLLAEKESLILEMGQKELYPSVEQEGTEIIDVEKKGDEKQAELKAVEALINEVDKAISSKEGAPLGKNKTKAKKVKSERGSHKVVKKVKKRQNMKLKG